MEALILVGIMTVIFFILSGILYLDGYKEKGTQLFQATLGFIGFYAFLVLSIGLAPLP